MAYVVRMPKLGVEMSEGTLLEWAVDEGDPVDQGDVLAEVESEKVRSEVPAREDGVLRRKYRHEGTVCDPGTPIGVVAGPDEDVADLDGTSG